jgi:hypothetical protein
MSSRASLQSSEREGRSAFPEACVLHVCFVSFMLESPAFRAGMIFADMDLLTVGRPF